MHLYRKTKSSYGSWPTSIHVWVCHLLELKRHCEVSAKPLKDIASQTEIQLPHDNGFCQLEQFRDCCEDWDGNYSQF